MVHSESFTVETRGRGTSEVTAAVQRIVRASGVPKGICQVFVHHTSASLILCENADSNVRRDLEMFFARLVPDGDPEFIHTMEGPDDMSAHIRSILTQSAVMVPVADGRCDLGTWQGIYLWEHRARPHRRRLTVTVMG